MSTTSRPNLSVNMSDFPILETYNFPEGEISHKLELDDDLIAFVNAEQEKIEIKIYLKDKNEKDGVTQLPMLEVNKEVLFTDKGTFASPVTIHQYTSSALLIGDTIDRSWSLMQQAMTFALKFRDDLDGQYNPSAQWDA